MLAQKFSQFPSAFFRPPKTTLYINITLDIHVFAFTAASLARTLAATLAGTRGLLVCVQHLGMNAVTEFDRSGFLLLLLFLLQDQELLQDLKQKLLPDSDAPVLSLTASSNRRSCLCRTFCN